MLQDHLVVKNKKYLIWDWNGTLLNDAEYCVRCMNDVLNKHHLENIDLKKYKDTFTFPVKDYYQAIGFDFNKVDFEIPAMEFIKIYYKYLNDVDLHNNAVSTLTFIKNKGVKQLALSAMEHSELLNSLTSKGIIQFFDEIRGINNHFANSKLEIGKQLLEDVGANKDDFVMIGDTIHDFEVATGMGIDCILVSNGHQSAERLSTVSNKIVPDLESLVTIFNS